MFIFIQIHVTTSHLQTLTIFLFRISSLTMLLLMLVLGFLLASVLVSAQHQVAGIGRLSSGSTDDVQDVYASAVNGIITSVNNGPNQTTSQYFPVEKLYGANVCVICLVSVLLLKGQLCFRLATGWCPKHGSFEYVLDIGS